MKEPAPAVDQTRTGVSQVVRNSQILNLPINGRRVDTYVLLTPAVVPDGVLGLVSFRGIAGGNVFLTDGNDTSNQFFDENAGRTRISTQISQDAVLEFQVLSSGLFRGIRPRLGRHHQHRDAQRVERNLRHGVLVFPQPASQRPRPVRLGQPDGNAPSGRRQPGRQARPGQAVLLLQHGGPPARFSAGRLARPSASVRRQRRVYGLLRGFRRSSAPPRCNS